MQKRSRSTVALTSSGTLRFHYAVSQSNTQRICQKRLLRALSKHTDNATDTSPFCLPVQANGADAFKLALIHISEKLNCLDARIVLTQHDEIIVEARDGIVDQVLAIVKESMEESLKRIIPEVLFAVEIRVADSWG